MVAVPHRCMTSQRTAGTPSSPNWHPSAPVAAGSRTSALCSCNVHPMPGEALAEELRNIRTRYHLSTFSLDIFVRDSLKGIDVKRDRLIQVLNEIRGFAS